MTLRENSSSFVSKNSVAPVRWYKFHIISLSLPLHLGHKISLLQCRTRYLYHKNCRNALALSHEISFVVHETRGLWGTMEGTMEDVGLRDQDINTVCTFRHSVERAPSDVGAPTNGNN